MICYQVTLAFELKGGGSAAREVRYEILAPSPGSAIARGKKLAGNLFNRISICEARAEPNETDHVPVE